MILTEDEYKKMWTKPTQSGFGMPIHTIPSYHQYLQREVYQQDYLDLFGGSATFSRESDEVEFGVPLKIFLEKNGVLVNPCSPYVKKIKGVDCLLVDYDYPYSKTELAKSKDRSIQFVLIGEAAPPLTASNEKNFYFYNINHRGATQYFNAPAKAFIEGYANKNSKKAKKETLEKLACKGVLLIDLFPFSIIYSDSFRKEIKDCCANNFNQVLKTYPKAKFSFLCSISHAEKIIKSKISILGNETFLEWDKWTIYGGLGIHKDLNKTGMRKKKKVENWHGLKNPIEKFKLIYKYRAYGKSNSGYPNHIPIRFSFNLK